MTALGHLLDVPLVRLTLGFLAAGIAIRAGAWYRRAVRRPAFDVAYAIAPGDAESGEYRYCPDELRQTYHAIHTDGARRCFTCNTETEADS